MKRRTRPATEQLEPRLVLSATRLQPLGLLADAAGAETESSASSGETQQTHQADASERQSGRSARETDRAAAQDRNGTAVANSGTPDSNPESPGREQENSAVSTDSSSDSSTDSSTGSSSDEEQVSDHSDRNSERSDEAADSSSPDSPASGRDSGSGSASVRDSAAGAGGESADTQTADRNFLRLSASDDSSVATRIDGDGDGDGQATSDRSRGVTEVDRSVRTSVSDAGDNDAGDPDENTPGKDASVHRVGAAGSRSGSGQTYQAEMTVSRQQVPASAREVSPPGDAVAAAGDDLRSDRRAIASSFEGGSAAGQDGWLERLADSFRNVLSPFNHWFSMTAPAGNTVSLMAGAGVIPLLAIGKKVTGESERDDSPTTGKLSGPLDRRWWRGRRCRRLVAAAKRAATRRSRDDDVGRSGRNRYAGRGDRLDPLDAPDVSEAFVMTVMEPFEDEAAFAMTPLDDESQVDSGGNRAASLGIGAGAVAATATAAGVVHQRSKRRRQTAVRPVITYSGTTREFS